MLEPALVSPLQRTRSSTTAPDHTKHSRSASRLTVIALQVKEQPKEEEGLGTYQPMRISLTDLLSGNWADDFGMTEEEKAAQAAVQHRLQLRVQALRIDLRDTLQEAAAITISQAEVARSYKRQVTTKTMQHAPSAGQLPAPDKAGAETADMQS